MKKFFCLIPIFIAALCVKALPQAAVSVSKTVHDTAVVLRANSKTYISDTATALRSIISANAAGKVSITDSLSGNNIRLDTGTFNMIITGITVPDTILVHYSNIAYQVKLEFPVAIDTSNSAAFTMTGVPSGLRPARAQNLFFPDIEDNTTKLYVGLGSLGTNGTITMSIKKVIDGDYTATFTNSNLRGIKQASIVSYHLQ